MTLLIRERMPLRLNATIKTPAGSPSQNRYRWGIDERTPGNVPTALTFSTTMPGGFEQANITLARRLDRDYPDLERLSTVTIRGVGGQVAWQGRIETAPATSGDQSSITPGLVGWQAHLDDNQAIQEIYVDQDASRWGDMPLNNKLFLATVFSLGDMSWTTQNGGLLCALPNQVVGPESVAEVWYVAPSGIKVAKIGYVGQDASMPAGWETPKLLSSATDSESGATFDALTFDNTLRSQASSLPGRYVALRVFSNGTGATPVAGSQRLLKRIAVYGNHGLTTHPIDSGTPDGLLASDVVAHALAAFAPLLTFTTGASGTIEPTSFVIPHLTFTTLPAAASDIVKQATRFELPDWAVWEDLTFWMNPRGARGKNWRTRVRPAQLQETGPQVDRIWNQLVVQYQDVDGTERTVGPPGSGADTEDASLVDTDPLNPANQLPNLARRDVLTMSTSTAAGAIQTGSRFLAEQKLLDRSGQASLNGHVEDDRGVLWPAWMVRAGDTLTVVDAADPSPRRIVKTSWDDGTKTNAVSLDAPPEGLQALLERMSVSLQPFGLA